NPARSRRRLRQEQGPRSDSQPLDRRGLPPTRSVAGLSAQQPYEPASDEEQPGGAEQPDGEPAPAASDLITHSSEPTLAGTGGKPGQDDGHPRRHGNQADEHEDEHRFSCDPSVSLGDLFGGRCDQGQRRDVRRHGEHAERKRRSSLARTTRTAVVTALATRRPAPAPSRNEDENSHVDQDSPEDE